MRRTLPVLATSLLLAGCAATPMAPATYDALILSQKDSLGLEQRCCVDLAKLPAASLDKPQLPAISGATEIAKIGDAALPALAFRLPAEAQGKHVEVYSFGPKKGGGLRLDRITFVRPQYTFLDAQGNVLSAQLRSPVCWGDFDFNTIGVWNRARVPPQAQTVVIAPDMSAPNQMVDTRRFTAAPVVEAIAEARQSYLSQVSFGYTGALSVRLVEPEPRCTAHPDAP